MVKKLKPSRTIAKQLKSAAKQANNNNNDNQNKANQNRIRQNVQLAIKKILSFIPAKNHVKARGLEDDEELSLRDLDTEEVFGREYDFLNERDIFDDLD